MAEKLIVLRNHCADRSFQATMYHDVVCARRQKCSCKTIFDPNVPKAPPRREEASFRIDALGLSEKLPEAVKYIPQVANALTSNPPTLSIVEEIVSVERIR